jgi:PKD repeat protein
MSTSYRPASISRRLLSAALALLLSATALLALAHPASALPPGGPGTTDPTIPPNTPPAARFSVSPNPAVLAPSIRVDTGTVKGTMLKLLGGALVQFDGSASSDADGSVAKYQWDFDGNGTYDVTSTTSATTSKRFTDPGTYHVRLRVTDDGGAANLVEHLVIVHRAPHAAIAATPAVALVGQQVSLSAAGSTDDNGISRYDWDLDGDGTFEATSNATPTISTSYATLATRNVKVRVRDIYGATAVAAADVVVHRAPTAGFTFAPNPPFVGEKVTFDGSSSGDDGTIKRYQWDLDGDGTFETDTQATPTVSKVYDAPGTIAVRLQVTDDHGAQDAISHAVRVDPKPAAGAAAASDATAPLVRISPRSVKVSRKGTIALRITCPAGERSCIGRLSLRSGGFVSSAVGGKSFRLGGGQTATVRVQLSRAAQRAVKRHHRLRTKATAVARDAAGNTGTSRATITIKR